MQFPIKIKREMLHDWWHGILYQWIKHYKLLFALLFLFILAAGIFQWQYHFRLYSWTEDEKKAFLERSIQEITFQERKFREVLEVLSYLREAHMKELPLTRDLFLGKKEKER